MILRPAMQADLPLMVAVINAAFAPYIAVIGQRPAPMLADHAAHIAAGQVWLAETPRGAGIMVAFPKAGAFELDILAVSPAAQGQGMGRALLDQCEILARSAGLPALTLYTNAAMQGALALYRRAGFTEIERRTEQGYDRVYFRKPLIAAA